MIRYFIIVPAVILIFISGCIEEIGRGINEFTGGVFEPNIKAEATVAEINAVGRLRSDDDMAEGFLAIASRKGISPAAQSHLVVPALSRLCQESVKIEVILELIKNPDFSHQAKKKILSNLHRLELEASRIKVLNAINHRQIGLQNPIPTSEGKLESILYE